MDRMVKLSQQKSTSISGGGVVKEEGGEVEEEGEAKETENL